MRLNRTRDRGTLSCRWKEFQEKKCRTWSSHVLTFCFPLKLFTSFFERALSTFSFIPFALSHWGTMPMILEGNNSGFLVSSRLLLNQPPFFVTMKLSLSLYVWYTLFSFLRLWSHVVLFSSLPLHLFLFLGDSFFLPLLERLDCGFSLFFFFCCFLKSSSMVVQPIIFNTHERRIYIIFGPPHMYTYILFNLTPVLHKSVLLLLFIMISALSRRCRVRLHV